MKQFRRILSRVALAIALCGALVTSPVGEFVLAAGVPPEAGGPASPSEDMQLQPAPPPAATPAPVDLHAYGDTDLDCLQWKDGCRICRRQDGGAVACSTPGIACLPGPIACTIRK